MTPTNLERITHLKNRIKRLNTDIRKKKLEDAYVAMVDELASGKALFEPVDEDTWATMLPKERSKHLLRYYHTLRTELHLLLQGMRSQSNAEKIAAYLHKPWVKVAAGTAALAHAGLLVADVLHRIGVFFDEEKRHDPLI